MKGSSCGIGKRLATAWGYLFCVQHTPARTKRVERREASHFWRSELYKNIDRYQKKRGTKRGVLFMYSTHSIIRHLSFFLSLSHGSFALVECRAQRRGWRIERRPHVLWLHARKYGCNFLFPFSDWRLSLASFISPVFWQRESLHFFHFLDILPLMKQSSLLFTAASLLFDIIFPHSFFPMKIFQTI